ncbi:MAG: hypothetical protein FJ207_13630 [Gemmatimonadetes bacterium]|nr:hypothetical protein [Gemmatimonadota bacterium]
MLKELAEKLQARLEALKKLSIEPVPYDPSHLNDEIASRTEWGPAKSGGASFRTHRLVDAGPRRVEFRATGGARLFYGTFAGLGALALVVFPVAAYSTMGLQWRTGLFLIIPVLVGSVFVGVGGAMWYYGAAPIVFDKQRGEYWKGRVSPEEAGNRHAMKDRVQLDRIHALQLISQHVSGNDSSYYSYELNLVLDDGMRMNVVDHGNLGELQTDAQALGQFLGPPVWDATA